MEEFKTVTFYIIQNLVDERFIASDHIAYVAKWDSLRAYMDIVMQNLKSFSSESVASSSQKLDHLEQKLTFITTKQEVMDVQLKTIVARQDATNSDLKAILELLKQKHYTLRNFRIFSSIFSISLNYFC